MSRYLQKAAGYNNLPKELMELIKPEYEFEAAEIIARLVNAGVVCVPRSCQSTVRLNIVREICKDLPISCKLEERSFDDNSGRTYKALVVDNV